MRKDETDEGRVFMEGRGWRTTVAESKNAGRVRLQGAPVGSYVFRTLVPLFFFFLFFLLLDVMKQVELSRCEVNRDFRVCKADEDKSWRDSR